MLLVCTRRIVHKVVKALHEEMYKTDSIARDGENICRKTPVPKMIETRISWSR